MTSVSEPVREQLNVTEHNLNKWEDIRKKFISNIEIRPYSLKEISFIFNASVPTFKKMLAPYQHKVGEQAGNFFSIRQVRIILQHVDPLSDYDVTKLAKLYSVSVPTMNDWLEKFEKELGERQVRKFSMKQLYIIVSRLDIPSVENLEKDDSLHLFLQRA